MTYVSVTYFPQDQAEGDKALEDSKVLWDVGSGKSWSAEGLVLGENDQFKAVRTPMPKGLPTRGTIDVSVGLQNASGRLQFENEYQLPLPTKGIAGGLNFEGRNIERSALDASGCATPDE